MGVKKLVGLVGLASIIFLSGCRSQPNVNKYLNPNIKDAKLKKQMFEEDSLRCELFANNSVSRQNTTHYINTSNNSGSGTFDMTNTSTGQQYSGSYNSYNNASFGSGFSSGLANGSAIGSSMAESMRVSSMREKAWKYCMLRSGWLSKE